MQHQTGRQLIKAALAKHPGKTKRELAKLAGVSLSSAGLELSRLRNDGLATNAGRIGPVAVRWYPLPDPPNLDKHPDEFLGVSSIWQAGYLMQQSAEACHA